MLDTSEKIMIGYMIRAFLACPLESKIETQYEMSIVTTRFVFVALDL